MGFWDRIQPPTGPATHREDFAGWAFEQARLVREARPNGVDIENVAEELESLGRQELGTLESHLENILLHLLKWDYQPGRRGQRWLASVAEGRYRSERVIRQNPSLKPLRQAAIDDAYGAARLRAARETRIATRVFPEACPYDWAAITTRQLSMDDPA